MSGKKIVLAGIILIAGYFAYKLVAVSQLNLQFTGLKFTPFPPRASVNFSFFNSSATAINIRQIAGNIFYQGQPIAVIFNQQSVSVPSGGNGYLSLDIRPNIGAVLNNLVSLGTNLLTSSAYIYFQGSVQTDVGTFPFFKYLGA